MWNRGGTGRKKKSFSTRTAFPAGSWCGNLPGIGWHCCWISFSFPCTEVAQPEDVFPMKWMRMGDSFCCCFIEGCPLYDSTVWSDLCPVMSHLTVMVGQHCDWCSSEAVVCDVWLYTCSLWHLFHRTIERSCDKRCVVKPDFVVCGTELLALTISWSLKQSIWRWVEMVQVVLDSFLDSFQIPGRTMSSCPIHIQHRRGRPGDICSW